MLGPSWNDSNCADGLGRLVSVTEPNPSTGAAGTVTNYTYDMLNNLSAVDIGGQSYSTCTLLGSSVTICGVSITVVCRG